MKLGEAFFILCETPPDSAAQIEILRGAARFYEAPPDSAGRHEILRDAMRFGCLPAIPEAGANCREDAERKVARFPRSRGGEFDGEDAHGRRSEKAQNPSMFPSRM